MDDQFDMFDDFKREMSPRGLNEEDEENIEKYETYQFENNLDK